jgi:hypothetical protein
MSGPCASVVLNLDLDDAHFADVERILQGLGSVEPPHSLGQRLEGWIKTTMPVGGTYLGEDRPFAAHFVCAKAMRLDVDRSSAWCERIAQEFGLSPMAEIRLSMGCNEREDHRILGELSLHLALHFGGLIDFTGALMAPIGDRNAAALSQWWQANWSDISEPTERMLAELPGKVLGMPYETANGRQWVSHICTPKFIAAWLQHRHFHMIK